MVLENGVSLPNCMVQVTELTDHGIKFSFGFESNNCSAMLKNADGICVIFGKEEIEKQWYLSFLSTLKSKFPC